jgi:hypothetical protein
MCHERSIEAVTARIGLIITGHIKFKWVHSGSEKIKRSGQVRSWHVRRNHDSLLKGSLNVKVIKIET